MVRGPGLITLIVVIWSASLVDSAVRSDPARTDEGAAQAGVQKVELVSLQQPAVAAEPAPTRQQLYVASNGDDGNPGTQQRPFRSIEKAASAARPGTEVRVAPGTYRGSVTTTASGTKNARISYVAEKKWAAKIIGTGGEVAWQNDGDYVDVVGFDISGEGEDGLSTAGSYNRLVRNRVHGFTKGNCMSTANGGYTLHDIDVIGNVVYGCGAGRLDHGIYVSHPGGNVVNNIAFGNTGYGIHCWHNCNRLKIANNLVFDNDTGGIVVGQGDGPNNGSVDADDFIVSNNIVVFNGLGIAEEGATGSNNKYINNNVFGNRESAMSLNTGKETGTIHKDPKFVDFKPDGTGDYRLQPSSPAINAGTTAGAPDVDIAGNRRPQGGAIDLGAYELLPSGVPAVISGPRAS